MPRMQRSSQAFFLIAATVVAGAWLIGREVFILAAEAIAHPGSHTRAPALLVAGLDKSDCRIVVDGFRIHTSYNTDLIRDLPDIWE